jgi:hypothetical protein
MQARDLSFELLILLTETGDLDRKPIVLVTLAGILGRKACNFLVRHPSPCKGLVTLLLPDLRPIAPESICDILSSVTHSGSPCAPIGRPQPHRSARCTVARAG